MKRASKQQARSTAFIESCAEGLLRAYADRHGLRQLTAPILPDDLAGFLGLTIDFDDLDDFDYPSTYAALFASQRAIIVDEDLDRPSNEAPCNYTIAHELGHWVLHTVGIQLDLFRFPIRNPSSGHKPHRPRGAAVVHSGQLTLFDQSVRRSLAPPVCRVSERHCVNAIETEAERFAAAILMPRSLVVRAFRRRFGTDYLVCSGSDRRTREILGLTGRPPSKLIAHNAARELAAKFRVSTSAMAYRLKNLRLLIEKR